MGKVSTSSPVSTSSTLSSSWPSESRNNDNDTGLYNRDIVCDNQDLSAPISQGLTSSPGYITTLNESTNNAAGFNGRDIVCGTTPMSQGLALLPGSTITPQMSQGLASLQGSAATLGDSTNNDNTTGLNGRDIVCGNQDWSTSILQGLASSQGSTITLDFSLSSSSFGSTNNDDANRSTNNSIASDAVRDKSE